MKSKLEPRPETGTRNDLCTVRPTSEEDRLSVHTFNAHLIAIDVIRMINH